YRAGTARINACGDSRLRCLRSRKPIGFRQWVVHKYSPEYLLSHECLYHNPKVFFSFYRQKMDSKNIQPNITHQVLAKLEAHWL
ncbi:MAG: hypothetical protein KHZ91_06505, partial [Firmicutes bacterium]|nr:hypothetical protein [Bacillota bacterium]